MVHGYERVYTYRYTFTHTCTQCTVMSMCIHSHTCMQACMHACLQLLISCSDSLSWTHYGHNNVPGISFIQKSLPLSPDGGVWLFSQVKFMVPWTCLKEAKTFLRGIWEASTSSRATRASCPTCSKPLTAGVHLKTSLHPTFLYSREMTND